MMFFRFNDLNLKRNKINNYMIILAKLNIT